MPAHSLPRSPNACSRSPFATPNGATPSLAICRGVRGALDVTAFPPRPALVLATGPERRGPPPGPHASPDRSRQHVRCLDPEERRAGVTADALARSALRVAQRAASAGAVGDRRPRAGPRPRRQRDDLRADRCHRPAAVPVSRRRTRGARRLDRTPAVLSIANRSRRATSSTGASRPATSSIAWPPSNGGTRTTRATDRHSSSPAFSSRRSCSNRSGSRPLLGRTLLQADEDSATPVVVLGQEFWQRQFAGAPDVLGTAICGSTARSSAVVGVMAARLPRAVRRRRLGAAAAAARGARRTRAWRSDGGRPPARRYDRRRRGAPASGDPRRSRGARSPTPTPSAKSACARSPTASAIPGAGPFLAVWQIAALAAPAGGLRQRRQPPAGAQHRTRARVRGAAGAWRQQRPPGVAAAGRRLAAVGRRGAPRVAAGLGEPAGPARDDARLDRALRRRMALPAHGRPHVCWRPRRSPPARCCSSRSRPRGAPRRQNVTSGLRQGGRQTSTAVNAAAGCWPPRRSRSRWRCWLRGPVAGDACIASRKGRWDSIPTGVLVGRVTLHGGRYEDPESRRQFVDRVLTRLSALPAVSAAGDHQRRSLFGKRRTTSFWREGVAAAAGRCQWTSTGGASRRTRLPLMRVPLLAGRMIQDSDRTTRRRRARQPVAGQPLLAGKNALGKRFRIRADGPFITVVGIVGDVTQDWLIGVKRAAVYQPFDQDPPVVLRAHAAHRRPIRFSSPPSCARRGAGRRRRTNRSSDLRTMAAGGRGRHGRSAHCLARPWRDCAGVVPAVDDRALQPDGVSHRPAHARDGLRMALGRPRWDVIRLTGATAMGLAVDRRRRRAGARVPGRASARAAAVRRHQQQPAAGGGAGGAAGDRQPCGRLPAGAPRVRTSIRRSRCASE